MSRIVTAGSIIVDRICAIDAYPSSGELAQIRSIARVPGGSFPIPAVTYAFSRPTFPSRRLAGLATMTMGASSSAN